MWIDQCNKGIELRNFDMKYYSILYDFLSSKFSGHFKWLAFDHRFFVSDKCMGRHQTIITIREFCVLNNL